MWLQTFSRRVCNWEPPLGPISVTVSFGSTFRVWFMLQNVLRAFIPIWKTIWHSNQWDPTFNKQYAVGYASNSVVSLRVRQFPIHLIFYGFQNWYALVHRYGIIAKNYQNQHIIISKYELYLDKGYGMKL